MVRAPDGRAGGAPGRSYDRDLVTTAPIPASEAPGTLRLRLQPWVSFLRFALRRLLAYLLLAVGITLVIFALTQLVPSNAAATNLGEQAAGDPAAVAAFKQHYGLDKPLPVRYAIYLEHLVQGDLGESALTHQPVTTDLGTFIPATAELALFSIVIASILGVTGWWVSADSPRSPWTRCSR